MAAPGEVERQYSTLRDISGHYMIPNEPPLAPARASPVNRQNLDGHPLLSLPQPEPALA